MRIRSYLALLVLPLAGCGGSGLSSSSSRPATSRLTVNFAWPIRDTRVIPTASNSIKVVVTQGAVTVGSAILVRPATTVSFSELPVGSITVAATAYPNSDATGNAMASASTSSTITANNTQTVDLTMASTIHHLTLTPNPINLAITGLLTRQTTVTAYDASNAVILTAAADISYSTSNSLLFNVNATGLVTGLAIGNATVTATDAISGKSATASVQITL